MSKFVIVPPNGNLLIITASRYTNNSTITGKIEFYNESDKRIAIVPHDWMIMDYESLDIAGTKQYVRS